MRVSLTRGPEWKRISRKTVMGRHLYPVGELPEDIKNLLQFQFGSAHLNKETDIVEVGGESGGKFNDMWFFYQIVREKNGCRGILEQPFLTAGWYRRLNGPYADYPSIMEQSLRHDPAEV